MGGLSLAMKAFRLKEGTIITMDQEDSFDMDGKKVRVMPAWKWMAGANAD
jgi:predicted AAA+ superfamily ATPase